jgi:hypothetical protein
MTPAQERLANLVAWLDRSSASFPSPISAREPARNIFGKAIPHPIEMVVVGRFAEILPWDFSTLPTTDFDPQALPLFVSQAQAEALNLPPVADLSPPSRQGRAADRLHQIVGKMEDAAMSRPGLAPWRADEGWKGRLCAVVGIASPDMNLADAVDAAGASGVDLDAFPLLIVPTWAMARKEKACLRLPFLPI